VAALGLATFVALPSAAAPDLQAAFKKLDANGDGVLSADEFAGPKGDGEVKDVFVETRMRQTKDGSAPPKPLANAPEVKEDAFTFWLPDELGASADAKEPHQYKVITQREIRIEKGDKDAAPEKHVVAISVDDLRKREFDAFDKDRDGKVSYAEFSDRQRAMMTRGFEILDANGDKSLSQNEYAKIVDPPMPKIDGHDNDDLKIDVRGGLKISPEVLKTAFTKLDANKDSKLSLQEYLPPA
jgi:Ca2+-binding EF-hand superfamily protein